MSFLVPIMMWGWIPVNIILFRKFTPQKAILISVIGGVLFLPVTTYDLPLINYDKEAAIAISLIFGIIISGKINEILFKPKRIDILIILWCILSPFLSLMANDYGLKHAIYAVVNTSIKWGVYYIAGRIFFTDKDSIQLLTRGIIIGGLIYVPLVLFEVRMSPQLSNIFYGFIPHSFAQLIRYSGYRPIVFMNHALMVALWMSVSFTVSLWLSASKEITKIAKIPMNIVIILTFISTILCKSSGPIIFLLLGVLTYFLYKKMKSIIFFKIIIIFIPIYVLLRISGILPVETIINYISIIFSGIDPERVDSLSIRFFQEQVFGTRAMVRPLLGWGGMDRAWPTDLASGETLVQMIDSLYLIVFSNRGFLGLFSLYSVLLIGPWKIMKLKTINIDPVALSVILTFFVIDSLLNAMINPVFILIAGSLISFSQRFKYYSPAHSEDLQDC